MTRLASGLLACAVALAAGGCAAAMVVEPPADAAHAARAPQISGRIIYDGNRDYLPRALADGPADSPVSFRYGYSVKYGSERTSFAGVMFIPPPLLAIPGVMGSNELGVAGQLEVVKGTEIIKTYAASARLKAKTSLLYEGETFTEMRRRGLLAVRDSIDAQLARDREALVRALEGR